MSGRDTKPLEFQQVSDHVYRLNIPWIISRFLKPVPVAVFLVQQDDKFLLVDAGAPNMEGTISTAIAKFFDKEDNVKGALSNDLGAFCATHFHVDHCGSLRPLWEMTDGQLPVYAHVNEIPFIQDGKGLKDQQSHSWAYSIGRIILRNEVRIEVPCQPIDKILPTVASDLNQSTTISQSTTTDQSLIYYHCPGHTPGHLCFCHQDDGLLLCGDAMMNYNGKLEESLAISTPNRKLARENTRKMFTDLNFTRMLASHDSTERGVDREVVREFLKL